MRGVKDEFENVDDSRATCIANIIIPVDEVQIVPNTWR